jgi:hypothetical protein
MVDPKSAAGKTAIRTFEITYLDDKGEEHKLTASDKKRDLKDQKVILDSKKPDEVFFVKMQDVPTVLRFVLHVKPEKTHSTYQCSRAASADLRGIFGNPAQYQAQLENERNELQVEAGKFNKKWTDYHNRVFSRGLSSQRISPKPAIEIPKSKIEWDKQGRLTDSSLESIKLIIREELTKNKNKRAKVDVNPDPSTEILFRDYRNFLQKVIAHENRVLIYENFLKMNCARTSDNLS